MEDSFPIVREEMESLKETRLAQGLRAGVGGAALLSLESGLRAPLREEGPAAFPCKVREPEEASPRLTETDPGPQPCVAGPGEAPVL